MALTSVNINQQVSADLTAQGIVKSIPIGGRNTVTDACDIGFDIDIKCTDTDNDVTIQWKNDEAGFSNKPCLFASNSDGTLVCSQAYGPAKATASVLQDPSMTDVPVIVQIVAVYYEAPTTNTGIVTVASSDNALGEVLLKSAGASALIVPRISNTTSLTTNFTFSATGDVVKVVALGNSS